MKQFEILRERITSRGGGVEISLTPYGYKDQKMTAYCNYLGGGMLGSVQNDCTIRDWYGNPELTKLADDLSRYFSQELGEDYDLNQILPSRAY